MLRYLGLTSDYPSLAPVADVVYYAFASAAIYLVFYRFYRRLTAAGYDRERLQRFILVLIAVGFLGSRAAGMFYQPVRTWSFDLFFEYMRSGGAHTYHASLLLPLIIVSALILIMKYRYFTIMDTLFLYVPMGHALARVGCLIVGCCWGRSVRLSFFGFDTRFMNPSPVYAIFLNISIFYFLGKLYDRVYLDRETRRRYEGSIFASYLLLYGIGRIILEIFRRERGTASALTQAQIPMIFFMLAGLVIFAIMSYRGRRKGQPSGVYSGLEGSVTQLFSLLGIVVSSLAFIFLAYYLTRRLHVFPWPFHGVDSLADAYSRVPSYLPMLLLPFLALYWLQRAGLPILQHLRWSRSSKVFYVALLFSVYYSIELLVLREPRLRGPPYWPPVVVLSLLNAVSEELVHRLGILKLFESAGYSRLSSIAMQSVTYSIIHFTIEPTFGLLSLLYGFLLGIVMERTGSVTPCIICHFAIDLGCIGKPLLSY